MRHRSRFVIGSVIASIVAGLSVLVVAPAVARAEQFILLDVTFTYTKMDADTSSPDKSHYYVRSDRLNPARPRDWTAPIDYRHGVVHVRTEVLDKPAGSENTRWTLCYIPNRGIGPGYGCTNTALYQEEGVFDFEQGMTEWWQNDAIDWTQGIKQMDLVMKDGSGGSGFAHLRPDFEKFFPTTLRITMIQVSAGSTYDPNKVPIITDGGAVLDAHADGATIQDDATFPTGSTGGGAGSNAGGAGGIGGGGAGGMAGGATAGAAGNTAAGGVGNAATGASGSGGGTTGSGSAGGGNTVGTSAASDEGGCSLVSSRPRHPDSTWRFAVGLSLMAIARRRRRQAPTFVLRSRSDR